MIESGRTNEGHQSTFDLFLIYLSEINLQFINCKIIKNGIATISKLTAQISLHKNKFKYVYLFKTYFSLSLQNN